MESIISACITGLLALMGIVISNVASNKSMEVKVATGRELTDEKIDQLRKSVEKHNSVVERMPVLEGRVDMIEKRVDGVETRLNSCTPKATK
jgi:hypothetical protein